MNFELLQRRSLLKVREAQEAQEEDVQGQGFGQSPEEASLDASTTQKDLNHTTTHEPIPEYEGTSFGCSSGVILGPVQYSDTKGMAMDDETLQNCAAKMPYHWPSTTTPIT